MDAMLGDASLFSRADAVEATWELIQPIMDGWADSTYAGISLHARQLGAARGRRVHRARWQEVAAAMTPDIPQEPAISQNCTSLKDVDACLTDLYARAVEQEGAVPTFKTVLLNLVVRAADVSLEKTAEEDATRVLTSVSSRVIVADRATSEHPEGANVSVVCGITKRGDKRLCGEVIRVHASEGSMIGGVMPLLLADVPVYLWMLGDIATGHEDAADLLQVANHVIVDSRAAVDLGHTFRDIEWLRRAYGGRRVVQDLAWASLHDWREAVASHFDSPAARRRLPGVTEITVRYSGPADTTLPQSLPLLFGCWLIERLGLTIHGAFHSRDEGFRLDVAREDHQATVRLISDSSAETQRLSSVVIKCGDDAVFTTDAGSDGQLQLTDECDGERGESTAELTDEDDVALVVRVLRSYRGGHVFNSVLEVVLKAISQFLLADESSARIRL